MLCYFIQIIKFIRTLWVVTKHLLSVPWGSCDSKSCWRFPPHWSCQSPAEFQSLFRQVPFVWQSSPPKGKGFALKFSALLTTASVRGSSVFPAPKHLGSSWGLAFWSSAGSFAACPGINPCSDLERSLVDSTAVEEQLQAWLRVGRHQDNYKTVQVEQTKEDISGSSSVGSSWLSF